MHSHTSVERTSDCELVVTRFINAPVRTVYKAWVRPEFFPQWWVPKSAPIVLKSCEMDVRVGGGYRLVFDFQGNEAAFFGTYREVVPQSRLVWSNDESGDAGQITTFEERPGGTRVMLHERYPSKEALDAAMASGGPDCMPETFDQLAAFVAAPVASQ